MFSDFFFCRSFRNCRFEVFDPSSYLVVIPEADAQKTDEILRGIPQEKIQQLCENGRRIYDSHYSSYDGMLNATLQVLEKWRDGGGGPWGWSKLRRAAAGRAELLAKKRHIDRLQNPAKLRRFWIRGGIRAG